MSKLIPIEFKKQRIMTTQQLSEGYGTEPRRITENFARNEERFIEGKHYFKLEGEELKEFKSEYAKSVVANTVNKLYLWTEKGAARHAKILDTDEAWEVYEELEETYFRVKENKPTCIEDILISQLQEMKSLKGDVQAIKLESAKQKEELEGIREAIVLNPNQWRKDTSDLINKIANKLGGFEHIKPVREEAYKVLDNTYGVSLKTRLLNKQKKMALEGVPKYKIDKVNYLDVIADDKKLINGYIGIVGKLAIKHGIKKEAI